MPTNPICTIRLYASGGSTMYVGNAVKITAIVSPQIPDSVTIVVKDPGGTILAGYISPIPMVQETDEVYSYIYQSNQDDIYGKYTIIVGATLNGNQAIQVLEIELLEQPGLLR